MKIDSLEELQAAFVQWRKTKRNVREPTPEKLVARARRCANRHGVAAVIRATQIQRSRLIPNKKANTDVRTETGPRANATAESFPAFSLLELTAPSAGPKPIAELETAAGVKLRLFEQTPEMLGLVSTLFGGGGRR